MTDNHETLDRLIDGLPREIAPRRDLWPGIRNALDAREPSAATPPRWPLGLAAALLVGLSSLTTYGVMRVSAPAPTQLTIVEAPAPPISYGLGRGGLTVEVEAQLAALSPTTRAVIESNLNEIRASIAAIHAALSEDPGNASLQQLLYSTHQRELEMLRTISRMQGLNADGVAI